MLCRGRYGRLLKYLRLLLALDTVVIAVSAAAVVVVATNAKAPLRHELNTLDIKLLLRLNNATDDIK